MTEAVSAGSRDSASTAARPRPILTAPRQLLGELAFRVFNLEHPAVAVDPVPGEVQVRALAAAGSVAGPGRRPEVGVEPRLEQAGGRQVSSACLPSPRLGRARWG